MLFKFNKTWKFLLILGFFWAFYAIFGFEPTIITIGAAILATFWKDSTHLL
jgi:hypothetical protein|tara:strand:+ start:812 stop:964 length:153 start_codon:yes stop_codon:yes gene_type:complete